MGLPASGWKNKGGTSIRSCNCGSWKNHWLNYSGEPWPEECSIANCHNPATLGAHIFNTITTDKSEWIVPACQSCNSLSGAFSLKADAVLVPASKQKTCKP